MTQSHLHGPNGLPYKKTGEYGDHVEFKLISQIMLIFDMFGNLRTQIVTAKWQLQLAIKINSLLQG